MSDYEVLFHSLLRIIAAKPDQTTQLLAVILAGGPFRAFLDKPELLSQAVVTAKRYVAEKKKEATSGEAPVRTPATQLAAPSPRPKSAPRVMSVRDLMSSTAPAKA